VPPKRSDVFAILGALNAAGVDYVVIGGVAVQAYGRRTATKDLDVTVSWEPANLMRLARALDELEARLAGVDGDQLGIDVTDPAALAEAGSLGLVTNAGDLDVLLEPDGAPPYAELRARAQEVEVRGIVVPVSSREDLIAMKVAADRRVDRDDLAVLNHPAQMAADLAEIQVRHPPDWAEQLLGVRPDRGRGIQRLWDRAAQRIHLFHTEFGPPSRDVGALQRAPTERRELRVWRRAVQRVAEARDALPADGLPAVADDLADALDQLRGHGRDG